LLSNFFFSFIRSFFFEFNHLSHVAYNPPLKNNVFYLFWLSYDYTFILLSPSPAFTYTSSTNYLPACLVILETTKLSRSSWKLIYFCSLAPTKVTIILTCGRKILLILFCIGNPSFVCSLWVCSKKIARLITIESMAAVTAIIDIWVSPIRDMTATIVLLCYCYWRNFHSKASHWD